MIENNYGASEGIHVPKEQFLVDYFSRKKDASQAGGEKPFNEILQSVQIKIEKKQLDALQAMPAQDAEQIIDGMAPAQAIDLLKESIDTLRGITG